jgi:hypothetical protein
MQFSLSARAGLGISYKIMINLATVVEKSGAVAKYVFITAGPSTNCGGGRTLVEDMCYVIRRAANVD